MKKGSFTGATERREGRFELADGGTILLDEISEISAALQAKLLRVLQEKEFERVGGNKTIQVKVRVLATTNRNLLEEVKKGNFREDLYYRLNVFPISVPALRERGGDMLLLAKTFLARHAFRHGLEQISFSKECEISIQKHQWPGNVRELENAVERAVILSETGKEIEPDLLGLAPTISAIPSKKNDESSEPVDQTIEEIEKQHIEKTLSNVNGDLSKATTILGVSLRTLKSKIKKFAISE